MRGFSIGAGKQESNLSSHQAPQNNEVTPKQCVHHKPGSRSGRPSQTTKEAQGTNEIDEPGLFMVNSRPMEAVGMKNV